MFTTADPILRVGEKSFAAICILDKSSHCLELSVSAGRMVLYLHG